MGGGQRSRIEPEPHSKTLESIPRRGDRRHFVVEGILMVQPAIPHTALSVLQLGRCYDEVVAKYSCQGSRWPAVKATVQV